MSHGETGHLGGAAGQDRALQVAGEPDLLTDAFGGVGDGVAATTLLTLFEQRDSLADRSADLRHDPAAGVGDLHVLDGEQESFHQRTSVRGFALQDGQSTVVEVEHGE